MNIKSGKFQHTVFPIFLFLKFIFFNGWMGVALALDDPWEGTDKEDFKVVKNPRNLKNVSVLEFMFLPDQRAGAATLLVNWQKSPTGKVSAALASDHGSSKQGGLIFYF